MTETNVKNVKDMKPSGIFCSSNRKIFKVSHFSGATRDCVTSPKEKRLAFRIAPPLVIVVTVIAIFCHAHWHSPSPSPGTVIIFVTVTVIIRAFCISFDVVLSPVSPPSKPEILSFFVFFFCLLPFFFFIP